MALSNATPHIGARKGQIAKRVLMPGDPKRAQWIAKTYLKKAKLVNDVRGMLAYTGYYKNKPVTVMAHGMGLPSVCIYSHELYSFYGVKVIYRIGSCGVGNKAKVNVGDVILASWAYATTPIKPWLKVKPDGKNIMLPTKSCNDNIIKTAKKHHIVYHLKGVVCEDFFYKDTPINIIHKRTGTSVLEMESFGLFLEAKRMKRKAACLLTVSDNIDTGMALSPEARATTFTDMVELALESIINEKV